MSAHFTCRQHPDAVVVVDYHAGDIICTVCGLIVGDRGNCRMSAPPTCREHPGAVLVEDYHADDMICTESDLVVDDSMSAQLTCREHPDAVLVVDYHAGNIICTECDLIVGDRMSAQLTCREHPGAVLVEDYHADDMICTESDCVIDDSMSAQLTCREHPDAVLMVDNHAGNVICTECGLIVGDRVTDVGSERRTFSNEQGTKDNSHAGSAENSVQNLPFHGSDVLTMIATGSASDSMRDESGKASVSSSNGALNTAYKIMAQIADRLNLPKKFVDRASLIIKKVHESKALKCSFSAVVVSACVYIACRQEGAPRTFKEIRDASKVKFSNILSVYKLILKILETSMDSLTPGDLVPRFCSDLGLAPVIQKAATHIAGRTVEMELVPGRSPIYVAAAAIYMASQASDDKKTIKEISDIAGVSEFSIKNSYKPILPKAKQLFPADFKFSTRVENLPTRWCQMI